MQKSGNVETKVSHADEISSDSISPTAHSDADDTSGLAFNPSDDSDQDAAIAAMEACLCDIRSWMINDKLMINDSKTEFMLTGTKAQLQNIKSATLTIGESIISPSTESLSLQPQIK